MNTFKSILAAGLAVTAGGLSGADSFTQALKDSAVSLNLRVRYEGVDQTNLRGADALTARTRIGFEPEIAEGWGFRLEAENIIALDRDSYNQAGLNPGGAGRAVVADPETTELNQAWLALGVPGMTATVGRQRLVLDNARFIGDVGWRQNNQTFDALVLKNTSWEKTTLTYFYLDRINRIFGRDHPQGRWRSNSHGLHVNTDRIKGGTLSAYAYLLEFEHAAANSSATYGVSWSGVVPLDQGMKLTYRGETAQQSDYGNSPLDYNNWYSAIEAGLVTKPATFGLGFETLGTNRGVGFKTPLATAHAFNGWADQFLGTPGDGLQDVYGKVKTMLPGQVFLLGVYHWFESEGGGGGLGRELDLVFSRKLSEAVTATAKFADFKADANSGRPDGQKIWLQLDCNW